ncbi:hypothetical protein [Nostoc sp. MG11]|uniref:hypothetical protein n=1 Tax=Nostoc sp. MG11 TaxID=2721166 RepID=UPI0018681FDF|nr:hypothetical protein [Nostoc sp. MG11]
MLEMVVEREIFEKYEPLLIEIKRLNDSGMLIDELINTASEEELFQSLKIKGVCLFIGLVHGGLLTSFQKLFGKYNFEIHYYLVESSPSTDFYNVGFFVSFKSS